MADDSIETTIPLTWMTMTKGDAAMAGWAVGVER